MEPEADNLAGHGKPITPWQDPLSKPGREGEHCELQESELWQRLARPDLKKGSIDPMTFMMEYSRLYHPRFSPGPHGIRGKRQRETVNMAR